RTPDHAATSSTSFISFCGRVADAPERAKLALSLGQGRVPEFVEAAADATLGDAGTNAAMGTRSNWARIPWIMRCSPLFRPRRTPGHREVAGRVPRVGG